MNDDLVSGDLVSGDRMVPGEILPGSGSISVNPGRPRTALRVENLGDRPVQVGSHFHFADANAALSFDRAAAAGQRLDIAAGTAVRFEPGVSADVTLVPLGGRRLVPGLQRRSAARGGGGGRGG